jgi:hypothetical protein
VTDRARHARTRKPLDHLKGTNMPTSPNPWPTRYRRKDPSRIIPNGGRRIDLGVRADREGTATGHPGRATPTLVEDEPLQGLVDRHGLAPVRMVLALSPPDEVEEAAATEELDAFIVRRLEELGRRPEADEDDEDATFAAAVARRAFTVSAGAGLGLPALTSKVAELVQERCQARRDGDWDGVAACDARLRRLGCLPEAAA